jgi:putative membrane protein
LVKHRLSDDDHRRVAEAIRSAESRTSGEIFVVVAAASGDYRLQPMLWSASLAMLGGFVVAALKPTMPAGSLALGQALSFVLMAAAASVPALRMILVPRAVQQGRASLKAREQFLARNLRATRQRTGVLIFVSLAEHYAEIIADDGIHSCVPENFWRDIVDRLTARIAAGQLADGLVEATAACGAALAEHFPRGADDVNELPDQVVEV